ncbi:AAA family ATPase [uncultured Microbacterium sp.]|uniref:AAA family ATPase n=1 Tax=uncultured Microbacterium sp. TaxID=191216 RepID=UPI0025D8562C|nr:AAA family ATPase [uncultured Microbacterium sp.]
MTAPTGSRMEWLEIRGFRAFGSEARRLDLTSQLIVIHAGNSHGKTSLAEAAEWLITGRSSRRDLFGGAKAEYNASLRNAHLPADSPVWVSAGIRDGDGTLQVVRRDLVVDFAGAADCESRLTVDGVETDAESVFGVNAVNDAMSAPVLLQHTLRYVLSTEPKQRATYFKALLALSDLDLLRSRVKAQATALEAVPAGPGAAPLQRLRLTRLASAVSGIEALTGDRQTLRKGVEDALLVAGSIVLGERTGSMHELRTELERAAQEQNEQLFPLTELSGGAVEDPPVAPDLREYLDEARRASNLETALIPVLAAVTENTQLADLDRPVDCPVCLTPHALTPARVMEIRGHLRSVTEFQAAAQQAEVSITSFRVHLSAWRESLRRARPAAASWNDTRNAQVVGLAEELGEETATMLPGAVAYAQHLDALLVKTDEAADAVDAVASHLLDLIRRRADIPSADRIDLTELRSSASTYVASANSDGPVSALRSVVEPSLRSRQQSEGTQELLVAVGLIDEIVDELHSVLQRTAASKRLGRADRALQKAIASVLDARFASMSSAIERWWNTIRPEELVGFAGVKRRASGAVFVNLVGALQSDLQGDAVERDALGVFSDSQLNALGLSTFLARAELVGLPFLFLDDPIPGSDGDHRLTFVQNTLAALLDAGVQVIITTYDPKLAEHAQTLNEQHEPITYDLILSNVAEGAEPSQTSDQFSNYMLQGEDGINAPTAAGRANASGAYRRAAERLAKQIIATNLTAAGTRTSIADVEKKATVLGELIPLVMSHVLSPDEGGKWKVMPRVLNPGNHDDGAPSSTELKTVRGNLRQFAKAHRAKWGSHFVT